MISWDEIYSKKKYVWGKEPTRILKWLIRSKKAPLDILDIGCGYGRDAIFFAEKGHTVTGIDISPVAISQINDCRINSICGNIEDIDIGIDKYDLVYSIAALYRDDIRSVPDLLNKILLSLKPEGMTVLSVLDDQNLLFEIFSYLKSNLEETNVFFRYSKKQVHVYDEHTHEIYCIYGKKSNEKRS